MNAERIFRALGLIDTNLIAEAAPWDTAQRQKPPWRTILTVAACLSLACIIGGWFAIGAFGHLGTAGNTSSEGASGGTSDGMGIDHNSENGGSIFMQYAGPVFPLTTEEPANGLTAERAITWDFSPNTYADGEPHQWGANVTDAYTLTNLTEDDITVTALYPFAGNLAELSTERPLVTTDGMEMETSLYAGPYSGGFQGTLGADSLDTLNLNSLSSWTEYKALLNSGEYLSQTLADYSAPILDAPVTVYSFSNFAAPHETYQAATQAITFTIDENATQILTYGINGMESRDDGFRRYSYFVPDGIRRESNTKLLIVLGQDIPDYTLQGYQNGGCHEGEEIDGVSCTVTRTKTTLGDVLDQLCQIYASWYAEGRAIDQENAFNTVPLSMYCHAVTEFFTQYGPTSKNPVDRYMDGRLDDILSETLYHDRVMYLSVPVIIPAKEKIDIVFHLWKAPSYDFHCSFENTGIQGYDFVTQLGSTINFTCQTASLENTETISITAQNFGFDLESGITCVTLSLAEEHYYLEIREKEN